MHPVAELSNAAILAPVLGVINAHYSDARLAVEGRGDDLILFVIVDEQYETEVGDKRAARRQALIEDIHRALELFITTPQVRFIRAVVAK